MDKKETTFTNWFDQANSMMADWKNYFDKVNTLQNNGWDDVRKMQQQWMENYQSLLRNASLSPITPFNNKVTQEAFTNTMKSTEVYLQLFQLWQPFFRQLQSNSVNTEDFWKLVDPSAFKTFVDNLFQIDGSSVMQRFMSQYNQMANLWMSTSNNNGKSYSNMFSNSMPFFNMSSQLSPESVMKWNMEFFRSTMRSFAPHFASTTNGTPPSFEQLSVLTERSLKYMEALNRLQNLLYKTSVSAWEKVMESVASKTKDNKLPNTFDEFYNEWSAINEKEFVKLFSTDEYAATQGELLNLQSEMTKVYEKQMESLLQPYPVVLRSQLDDVHKQNHELRKKINDLEKRFSEMTSVKKTSEVQKGEREPA
jgi:hypothetical protein